MRSALWGCVIIMIRDHQSRERIEVRRPARPTRQMMIIIVSTITLTETEIDVFFGEATKARL